MRLAALPSWAAQVDLLDLGEGRDSNFRYVLIMVELKVSLVKPHRPSRATSSSILVTTWCAS